MTTIKSQKALDACATEEENEALKCDLDNAFIEIEHYIDIINNLENKLNRHRKQARDIVVCAESGGRAFDPIFLQTLNKLLLDIQHSS